MINDGSTDKVEKYISDFLQSASFRIRYIKNSENRGLGAAINLGLDMARYEHIAYLPADDFYDPEHLASFKEKFDQSSDIVLAFSSHRCDLTNLPTIAQHAKMLGVREGYCLQLVQTAHKKTADRWMERKECFAVFFIVISYLLCIDRICAFTNKLWCSGSFSLMIIPLCIAVPDAFLGDGT